LIESTIQAASNRETSDVPFRRGFSRLRVNLNSKIPGTRARDKMQQLFAFPGAVLRETRRSSFARSIHDLQHLRRDSMDRSRRSEMSESDLAWSFRERSFSRKCLCALTVRQTSGKSMTRISAISDCFSGEARLREGKFNDCAGSAGYYRTERLIRSAN